MTQEHSATPELRTWDEEFAALEKTALGIKDERDRLSTQVQALREALKNLIPVAEETCKQWSNDDCFLIPTEAARKALHE